MIPPRLAVVTGDQGRARHAAVDADAARALCGRVVVTVAANAFRPLDASMCGTCRTEAIRAEQQSA